MSKNKAVEAKDVVYREISVRDSHSSWARLLWQDHGRVIILSDLGHWSFWWGYRGDATVPECLTDLNVDYMGSKMLGSKLWEYCLESTVQCIKESVIQARRFDIDRDEAREEWGLMLELEQGYCDFSIWAQQTGLTDCYELRRDRIVPEWERFWNRLWVPLIVPALIREIENAEAD